MDAESALAMLDSMGIDRALGLEGDSLAGMFGALDDNQIAGFESGQLFDAAAAMSGEHFQFLDSDSAFGIFTGMGLDQALNLDRRPVGRTV